MCTCFNLQSGTTWSGIWLKIQGYLFCMLLWHNDTSWWPISKTSCYPYMTFSLHNVMFWPHGWELCLNDIIFRLYYKTFWLQSNHCPQKPYLDRGKCRTTVTLSKGKKWHNVLAAPVLLRLFIDFDDRFSFNDSQFGRYTPGTIRSFKTVRTRDIILDLIVIKTQNNFH